jgi:hypothetical protein
VQTDAPSTVLHNHRMLHLVTARDLQSPKC